MNQHASATVTREVGYAREVTLTVAGAAIAVHALR